MSAKSTDFRRFPLLKPFSPRTPSKIFDAIQEKGLTTGWQACRFAWGTGNWRSRLVYIRRRMLAQIKFANQGITLQCTGVHTTHATTYDLAAGAICVK
jgi:hypothetical protein